jgi:hypothetical protein
LSRQRARPQNLRVIHEDLVMPETLESPGKTFLDRRSADALGVPVIERRQFTNSHEELSPAARELAQAIDQYKLRHRRRFITYEEMLDVIQRLGYHQ